MRKDRGTSESDDNPWGSTRLTVQDQSIPSMVPISRPEALGRTGHQYASAGEQGASA